MFPWLFLWSPQYYFPFSGTLSQEVAPDTDWFFGAIPPSAGDGQVERKVFEANSYGRQIGILSDALMSVVEPGSMTPAEAKGALERFRTVYQEVNEIKARYKNRKSAVAIDLLEQIQASDPQELKRIVARFQSGG
jgi:hypothetical protein